MMASERSLELSEALQRAETAESEIAAYKQKFIDKYGIEQTDLLSQLNELKVSLLEDEKQVHLNQEEIDRNTEIIKESYHQLHFVLSELHLKDTNNNGEYLDGEDFRVMMKKYFDELKIECLLIKNNLNTEQLWDRVIAPNYKLSTQQLRNIRNLFVKDIHFALNKNQNKRIRSSLKLNGSFIYSLPNNSEQGVYYALDWNGDTLRILRFEYNQHPSLLKHYETTIKIKEKYKTTPHHTQLFDFIALNLKKYMVNKFGFDIRKTSVYHIDHDENIIKIPPEDDDEYILSDYRYPMGLSFSFPIQQNNRINEAVLLEWSNGYSVTDVIGKDIVQLLQSALDKYNVPLRIDAVIGNESVSTLLNAAFEKSGVRVSMVLGSPLSAAYVEPKRNNEIIDIAMSSFNKCLPRMHSTDLVMNSYSFNKGNGAAEKIISAEYLGELIRLLSLDVFGDKIRRYNDKTLLNKRWGLTSRIVSQILEQFDSQNMQEIYRILRMDLGLQEFSGNDGKLFVQLCRVMVNRSADLASTFLLGILEKAKLFTKIKGKESYVLNDKFRRKCIVGMDGSVWRIMTRYHQRMRNTMQKIVNKKITDKIKLVNSFDGNAKGSSLAIIANNNFIRHQQYLQNQEKYD